MRNLISLFAVTAFFAMPSFAATISNCDEIAHSLTIVNAGETKHIELPPGQSIESTGPMVSASVDKGAPVSMQMRDVYCIRKGKLSLQMRRNYSNKRQ